MGIVGEDGESHGTCEMRSRMDTSTETSLESGGTCGRSERIRSARESVECKEGPVTSNERSMSRSEHRAVTCEIR